MNADGEAAMSLIMLIAGMLAGVLTGSAVTSHTAQKDCQVVGVTRFGDTAFECRPLPTKAILGVMT